MTSRFCVVGSPIEHSLSPLIHNAAYSRLGLDYRYEKHLVLSGNLEKFLHDSDHAGLSVTMPLKHEAALGRVGQSVEVDLTLVANTLVREGAGWFAHNTDVLGFEKVFEHVSLPETATIVGTGATARSACLALSRLYPSLAVTVIGRNALSVEALVAFCTSLGIRTQVGVASATLLESSGLVVSTVPGDGFASLWSELSRSSVLPDGLLFDVAYNPWPSVAASSWKGESLSGLELLIWQAIEQIQLFASSQGDVISVDGLELYELMTQAVNEQTNPR